MMINLTLRILELSFPKHCKRKATSPQSVEEKLQKPAKNDVPFKKMFSMSSELEDYVMLLFKVVAKS